MTRWLLEAAREDGAFETICDKRDAQSDLPHDLVVPECAVRGRYVRLTVAELPYGQRAAVSGLRVFGKGGGAAPEQARDVSAERTGPMDMRVRWRQHGALGANVLWGDAPERLYHSRMVFGASSVEIGALNQGQACFVRVDVYNESGITRGEVLRADQRP